MSKRALIPFVLLLASCGSLLGQTSPFGAIPNGTVGVPYSVDLSSAYFGGLFQELQSEITGTGVELSITYAASGSLPPGLSLSGSVVSGTPSQPGNFSITITVTIAASYMQYNFSEAIPIPVNIEVDGFAGSGVSLD